jgi:hypothetical protein
MGKKVKKEGLKRETRRFPNISFTKKNYLLLLLAIIVIIAGFFFLARGSTTLAPILLVLGYCVLVPLAILWK